MVGRVARRLFLVSSARYLRGCFLALKPVWAPDAEPLDTRGSLDGCGPRARLYASPAVRPRRIRASGEWPSLYASSWRPAAARPLSAVRREGAVAGRALVQDVLLYGVEGVSVVCVISTQTGCRRSASAVIERVRSAAAGVAVSVRLVVAIRGCTPSVGCTARGGGRWTRVGAGRSAVRRGRRVCCCMRHQHAAGCRRSASAVVERSGQRLRGVAVTVRPRRGDPRGCTPSACCTARGGGRWTRVGAERSAVRRGRRVCRMRHQHAAGCRRSALAVIERVRSAAAGVAVTVRLVVAIRGCTPSALCTAWKAQPLDARVGAGRSAVRRGRRVCCMRHQHAVWL